MLTVEDLYKATDDGLKIVLAIVPQAADSVSNLKKKFKLRPDERTASAMLYAPTPQRPYWGVVDYGAVEGGRMMSPIDLYMREHNYGQDDFHRALLELCNNYGITENLSPKVNKPEWKEARPAREDEQEGAIAFEIRGGGFKVNEVKLWGRMVEVMHLEQLGFKPVAWWGKVKDGQIKECHSTDTYPQFALCCPYIDNDGNNRIFYKLYKPMEPNKQYRFAYVGDVPKNYVYGLDALKRAYNLNEGKKLPVVALVSGGSDAVNCLSMGVQPVWLNSETADMTAETYKLLSNFAEKIINIPDLDATGVEAGKRLALQYVNIRTLWLPEDVMGTTCDNRGHKRKDLKDYLQLRPSKSGFKTLIDQAMSARFWYFVQDKNGKNHPEISLMGLSYFLWLYNFRTLKDPHSKDVRFIRIKGVVVEEVNVKDIIQFLIKWMKDNGVYQNVQDKILRSKDVTTHIANTLPEVELDFSTSTATSQWFYFENCAVEVTKDARVMHQYRNLVSASRYVWKDIIIPHRYVEHDDMFRITSNGDGAYSIDVLSTDSNLFCFMINASRNFWRKELEENFSDRQEALAGYLDTHKFCINGDGLSEVEVQNQKQSLVNKIFAYGYLLYSHKVMSRARAVILYDSRIGTTSDQCNGRSGKSVFGKSLKNIKDMFPIEAKNPKVTESQYLYAGVDDRTDIVFVDECHKSLDYSHFFGPVTDDFHIERKYVDPYYIPFSKSPKILIATNYVIKTEDSSTEARMLPVVFSDYYHQKAKSNDYRESRSVSSDFGFNLFDESYEGWDADYAFMIQCLQWYLSVCENDAVVMPPMDNIERRQQKVKIGASFEEWADDYFQEGGNHLDEKLKLSDVYGDYKAGVGQRMAVDQNSFVKKIKLYCDYVEHIACYNPKDITGKAKDGERWRIHETNAQIPYMYVRSTKASIAMAEQARQKSTVSPDLFGNDGLYEENPFM